MKIDLGKGGGGTEEEEEVKLPLFSKGNWKPDLRLHINANLVFCLLPNTALENYQSCTVGINAGSSF